MSTKYIGDGEVILWTAGSTAITANDVVVVRAGATGMIGVALADITALGTGSVAIEGVFTLTKKTGTANVFAVGDICYWDIAESNISKQASANVKAGVCVEASAKATTTIKVKLLPSKA